jgi:hypothetical protein
VQGVHYTYIDVNNMNKYLPGKAYFFSGAFYANGFLGVFDIVARISFPTGIMLL